MPPRVTPMAMDSCPALQTLKALIEQCWHPNPERRPSFLIVIKELSQLLDNMPRKVSDQHRHTHARRAVHRLHSLCLRAMCVH